MREILFRGKAINRDPDREYRTDYKNGDWVYGLISKLYDEESHKRYNFLFAEMTNESGVSGIDVDYKTIGQYTGLTDKNGNKIFEGDIVKTSEIIPAYGTDTFTIEFAEGNFYICNTGTIATLRSWAETVKVIGNVHDNSELIGGEDNVEVH